MQRSIPILWALVILLLLLNLLVLDVLNLARLTAIETLSRLETMLDRLANEVIVYNVEVDQAVPLQAEVPIKRTMNIPLNAVVPIDKTLSVPFQTPAGEVTIEVPVRTEVPINTVVTVDFDQTINVDTVVQLKTTLPVKIEIAKTPLADYLKQAKSEIARLRNRLALKRGGVPEEPTTPLAPQSKTSTGPVPADEGLSGSAMVSAQDASDVAHRLATDLTPASDKATEKGQLGLCAHPYWPLWPGTAWTYNSPDSSFTQRVDQVSSNQAFLSTQYEGRDILSSLTCSPAGLGGNYLGDMRRIAELGDLNFSNPRGVFLPDPATLEERKPWRQELDVAGSFSASQEDSPLEGRINRGRAVAVYTPIRFETVETPLGPREALRVEQQLDLELDIVYDLGGQPTPATEIANLSTVYWFVKDMGLVKAHWQGGTLQQATEIRQAPVTQESPVPALAEDQLVNVCVTLANRSVKCARSDQLALTRPPESELEVQGLVFPVAAKEADTGVPETATDRTATQPDSGQSKLLAYAAPVASIGQQLSDAAEGFGASALKYRSGQLTLDQFQAEFLDFAPKVKGLMQQINLLSPPPEAEAVHQKLTDGLSKCSQAVDLMGGWFNTRDSGTKEAAMLLVAACVDEVSVAGDQLSTLTGTE